MGCRQNSPNETLAFNTFLQGVFRQCGVSLFKRLTGLALRTSWGQIERDEQGFEEIDQRPVIWKFSRRRPGRKSLVYLERDVSNRCLHIFRRCATAGRTMLGFVEF